MSPMSARSAQGGPLSLPAGGCDGTGVPDGSTDAGALAVGFGEIVGVGEAVGLGTGGVGEPEAGGDADAGGVGVAEGGTLPGAIDWSEATTWTIADASSVPPPASVWVATMVDVPATGVSPTLTSNVPSDDTVTAPVATDPSTDTVTAEHGAGQNPAPWTVTTSPGMGWVGVTVIAGDEPTAAGDPTRATSAIVPRAAARRIRAIVVRPPRRSWLSITSR